MNSSHPTKVLLIQTTVALIKIRPMAEVTIDLVLSESGISKGSLYHFADFADLIEQAEVAIFVDQADISLNDLQEILQKSHSREEFLSRIRTLTHRNMGAEQTESRLTRIQGIAISSGHERMAKAMGEVQLRKTEGVADLFRAAKERGWSNNDLDPYAVALFVQSYNIGAVIDTFTPNQMDFAGWSMLIDLILNEVILQQAE
jgi:AcrR family transcriptional regulator